jgi:hypothetical protein
VTALATEYPSFVRTLSGLPPADRPTLASTAPPPDLAIRLSPLHLGRYQRALAQVAAALGERVGTQAEQLGPAIVANQVISFTSYTSPGWQIQPPVGRCQPLNHRYLNRRRTAPKVPNQEDRPLEAPGKRSSTTLSPK